MLYRACVVVSVTIKAFPARFAFIHIGLNRHVRTY